ncbi:MAG TPA: hypothetical protein VJ418_24640, partial [Streptosporangiaceae bacterium]|nr:hypothetical protein [Streptosporangiaceae bacterium]
MGQADWVGAVPSGYAHFSKLGMFTGSGAIEGAIKAIIALRCQHASGRWDELWPASTTMPARP